MKIIGLTGGIGSGKTTITKMFSQHGVPVYIADDEAKKLMHSSKIIKRKLCQLLGEEAYANNTLNKTYIANKIFNNKDLLEAVNAIVHPKVASHFKRWLKKHKSTYCIKESAILFEKGLYMECDYTILVTCPAKLKIQRLLQRDKTSVEDIKARMKNQWKDAKKKKLANFVIHNTDLKKTQEKVKNLHILLSKL